MKLSIAQIRFDDDLQPRVALDQEIINEYAEAMKEGNQFPEVVVFHDGIDYWLADGFHRVHAAKQIGATEIDVNVHNGTKKDALLFSVSANAEHGLRRTQADKKKAVMSLLTNSDFYSSSDRELGKICKVDGKTVAKYRHELDALAHSQEVVDFFNGKLVITNKIIDIYGKYSTQNDFNVLDKIIVPEVLQTVHKLKDLGVNEITGPAHFWGFSKKDGGKTSIQLATNDGVIWWCVVLKCEEPLINADNADDIEGCTNSEVVRGFDMIIKWLYVNGGPDSLPSKMDLIMCEPLPEREVYCDNLITPEMAECAGCGKEVMKWGKNGMHHLKSGNYCPSCYAIQPTQIMDGKEVLKSGMMS